jgi:hypothetical protein
MAVTMKITVFWDGTLCSLVDNHIPEDSNHSFTTGILTISFHHDINNLIMILRSTNNTSFQGFDWLLQIREQLAVF